MIRYHTLDGVFEKQVRLNYGELKTLEGIHPKDV